MSKEITVPTPTILTSKSFDGRHIIQFNEKSHKYKLNGKPCVGVTTFVKAGYPTSMGLISWFKGQSINYTFDWFLNRGHVQSITEDDKKELFKAAKAADQKTSQEAADVGTILHDFSYLTELGKHQEAQELYNKVLQLSVKDKIINGIDKFKKWKAGNQDELVASESLIGSPTYLFCGKFDRLAKRNGKLILSDFKTSNSIYPDHFIQLGGYSIACREWLGMKVEGLEVLRFSKEDGEFETMLIDDPKEIQMFEDQAVRCKFTYDFRRIENDSRFSWKNRNA